MAASDPPEMVVCDAGPLIHLDELHCMDCLSEFRRVHVPDAVWQEVEHHRPKALGSRHVRFIRVRGIRRATREMLLLFRSYPLQRGEMEALRLMHQLPDALLLTDDNTARLVARQMGYEVNGTIGMLIRSFQRGQRSKRQVLRVLRDIPICSSLHVRKSLLNSVILQVEEGVV